MSLRYTIMPGTMHRLACGVMRKPSPAASLTLGLLLTVFLGNGCGPLARLNLTQPRPGGGQRLLQLESDRAQFATADVPWDRLLLAWPLPGARTGGEHFILYLRLPPGPTTAEVIWPASSFSAPGIGPA